MKQTYKMKDYDAKKLSTLSNMTGDELMFLLRRLGITCRNYGLMCDPPIGTGAGVNYYRYHKTIPMRLIVPLVERYPTIFLEELLKKKYENGKI